MEHDILLCLLKQEVKPAVGCTEPAAVALAVAKAARLLGETVLSVKVQASVNIIKNALAVTIPNTNEAGLHLAAALGMVLKKPEKGLEILMSISEDDIRLAHEFVDKGRVKICQADKEGLYIEARVEGENGYAVVKVKDSHTNITETNINGEIKCFEKNASKNGKNSRIDVTGYSLKEFLRVIESIPLEDIAFLQEGIDMNLLISRKGLEAKQGLGVGFALKRMLEKGVISNDMVNKARIMVASAADARMAGVNLPVMTTMGSGNHGIEAILPLAVVASETNATEEKVIRALALSHLITAYVKQQTGRLSPICGCSIAAGVGATAAITWLMGGSLDNIVGAVKNLIANLTGMICDGAKGGCALKLSTSAGEAVIAALLSLEGIIVGNQDGIISNSAEETIRNLGVFSQEGMASADEVILNIILTKKQDMNAACNAVGKESFGT